VILMWSYSGGGVASNIGFYLGFLCGALLIHSYDSVQQYLVRQFIFIAHAHDVRNGNELVVCTLGVR
jgi:hypothetical protein